MSNGWHIDNNVCAGVFAQLHVATGKLVCEKRKRCPHRAIAHQFYVMLFFLSHVSYFDNNIQLYSLQSIYTNFY